VRPMINRIGKVISLRFRFSDVDFHFYDEFTAIETARNIRGKSFVSAYHLCEDAAIKIIMFCDCCREPNAGLYDHESWLSFLCDHCFDVVEDIGRGC
jgi:hypothetical protein